MRQIGTYTARDVNRFVDFMEAEGISVRAEQRADSTFELWVIEEDQVDVAKEKFAEFQQNPSAVRYDAASKEAAKIRAEREEKQRRQRKNVITVRRRSAAQRAPLTMVLIVISVAVFALTDFGFKYESSVLRSLAFMSARQTDLQAAFENPPTTVEMQGFNLQRGEWWRALTPIFLHMNFIHIIFNCMWVFSLGSIIERREGTPFLFALVVLAGVISNLFQGLMPPSLQGTEIGMVTVPAGTFFISPFGGISGVVYGLFGFVWIRGTRKFVPEYRLAESTIILVLGWMLLGIVGLDEKILGMRMADWGHGMGFVVGVLFAISPLGRSG